MLRLEGAHTLNLRLDSLVGRVWTLNLRLDSPIRRTVHKNRHPDLHDARLLYGKRMAYAAYRGSPYAEPTIRLSDQKDSIQNQAP